jgi:hypothetical protein
MTILKNVVITTKYNDRNGVERKRYTIIGHMHNGQYGDYLTLNADVNLAAFPRKEGDMRITANLYDPKPRDGEAPKQSAAVVDDGFGDEIPFN